MSACLSTRKTGSCWGILLIPKSRERVLEFLPQSASVWEIVFFFTWETANNIGGICPKTWESWKLRESIWTASSWILHTTTGFPGDSATLFKQIETKSKSSWMGRTCRLFLSKTRPTLTWKEKDSHIAMAWLHWINFEVSIILKLRLYVSSVSPFSAFQCIV